ncbi:methyl-accepting chemotaxis protein [Acidaminobacter sp. JC074]|uniref:methyl-accepting chemotaxis protein n=1 Tax=Acidaminobacter sp. JC074 TaxID=2530199 RepID=UPI001F108075|nr:methyl-accepting chemotaxis protein [Acidaminobacter sp. JC074]MCH4890806.1 methyl-accepting chemotaxis protein [Acidaminobacter sp. JC074]
MKKSFVFKLSLYFGLTILVVSSIIGVLLVTMSVNRLGDMRQNTSVKLTEQTRDTITEYLVTYNEAMQMMSVDSNVLSTPYYKPSITWLMQTFNNFVDSHAAADFIYVGYEDTSNFREDMKEHVRAFYGNQKTDKGASLTDEATLNADKGFFAYPHFYSQEYDPRARGWYGQAMGSNEVVWTDSYIDAFTGLPVVTVAKKIVGEDGKALGVIGADISLSTISETYKDFKVGNTGALFITDSSGAVISHPNPDEIGEFIDDKDFWAPMSQSDSGSVEYTFEGVEKELYFVTEPNTGWKIAVTFAEDELKPDIQPLQILGFVFTIVCIIGGILIAVIVAVRITKDLNKVNVTLSKVADGDLTEKVSLKRKDEIGQMGDNLNKTIDTLNEIVNEINSTSEDVKMNADNLTNAINETTKATEEIAQSIQDVASGTTTQAMEVSDGSERTASVGEKINQVNQLSNNMGQLSDTVKVQSEAGLDTMKTLIDKAKEKEASSEQLSFIITSVDEQSKKISEITTTISSIADQTNLLALNASIESARAGEAGRGFAVVADEIRKLAEQSSNASNDIKELIDNMLNQSSEAVQTVEKSRKIDSEEFEAVKTTEETFNNIFNRLNELLGSIEEIKTQNNDIENDSNSLLDVMNNVSSITEQTSAASQQVSASTEEQLASMEEITSQTEHLRQSVQNLHQLIMRFKV